MMRKCGWVSWLAALLFLTAALLPAGAQSRLPQAGQALAGYQVMSREDLRQTAGFRLAALHLLKEEAKGLHQQVYALEIQPGADKQLQVRLFTPEKGLKSRIGVIAALETSLSRSGQDGFVPLAAINGDFFDTAAGGALGLAIGEGRLLQSPEFSDSAVLAVTEDLQASISYPSLALSFRADRAGQAVLADTPIDALNHLRGDVKKGKSAPNNAYESRQDNSLVLYTADFYRSTMQADGGTEVLLTLDGQDDASLPGLPLSGQVRARVQVVYGPGTNTVKGTGKIAQGTGLHQGSLVLSAMPRADRDLLKLKPGDEVYINVQVQGLPQGIILALGGGRPDGGPVLVKDGRLMPLQAQVDDYQYFYPSRHARTAVGTRPDGSWFVLVAGGYQPRAAEGLTVEDLAELMLALGAHDAINLDGGGSSTLAVLGEDGIRMLVGLGRSKEPSTPVGNGVIFGLSVP